MRKITKQFISILLSVCMIMLCFSDSNVYAEEVQAPAIIADSLTISTTQATVGDVVTFSIGLANDNGTSQVSIFLSNTETHYATPTEQMTYNELTGLYEYQFKITDDIPNGLWRVSYIGASDQSNNYIGGIYDFGDKGCFKVTGTAADSQAPVIDATSLTISTSQATTGDIVTISVKATDDGEMDTVKLNLENTNVYSPMFGLPMTYNTTTGLYEYQFEITNETSGGKWKVTSITAEDKAGNYSQEYNFGENIYFKVHGTEIDSQLPVIDVDSLTITPTQAMAGDVVTISVRVTDDKGIKSVWFTLNNEWFDSRMPVMTYNETTGLYEYQFEVTDETSTGTWKIGKIGASDIEGNEVYENDLGEKGSFIVERDSQAPNIDKTSLKLSKTKATVGDTVNISVKATDNIGIDSITLSLISVETNYWMFDLPMTYNETTGFYEYPFKITDETLNGRWKIMSIMASDKAGNRVAESDFTENRYFKVTGTKTNPDIEAPIIDASSLQLSKTKATVGDTINASIKVTDNAGINYVTLYLKNTKSSSSWSASMTYNEKTKLYEGQIDISDTTVNGKWTVASVVACDTSYNYTEEKNFGEEKFFEVSGTKVDSQGADIDTGSVKYSMSKATTGDTVTISLKVTDNSEIEYVFLTLQNMDTNYSVSGLNAMTYNKSTGLYEYQFKITDEIPNGRYRLSYITVYDKENPSTDASNFGEDYFTVTGTKADSEAPVIDAGSLTFDKTQVKAGDTVKATLKATDNVGITSISLNFEHIQRRRTMSMPMTYNEATGLYEGSLEITPEVLLGDWKVSAGASDKQGNSSSVSEFSTRLHVIDEDELGNVSLGQFINTSKGVQINWIAADNAETYRVYRKIAGGKWATIAKKLTGTSYTDSTAQQGVTYYYTVRAVNGSTLSSSYDGSKSITCVKQLADVTLGALENTKQGVTINWTEVSGAKTYQISRRTADGRWKTVSKEATGNSYVDKTAEDGELYYYTVRALNDKVISASYDKKKNITCVKQLADVTLGSLKNTKQGVVINWTEVSGAQTYQISRRTADGKWKNLSRKATGTSYTDNTAQNGVTYYYTVRALNGSVISASYDKKKSITSVNKLDNVTMEKLTSTNQGVQVKWKSVEKAKCYRVYRRTADGKWATLADKITGTSYIDKTAKTGTTYYYTVRALNDKVISPSYDGSKKITYSK